MVPTKKGLLSIEMAANHGSIRNSSSSSYSYSYSWWWWQNWTRRQWCVFAAGSFTLLLMAFTFLSSESDPQIKLTSDMSSDRRPDDDDFVPLRLLRDAEKRGAVCLDGSVPGYHFQKGFGSGSPNWVLHIEGGGWCNTIASCSLRKNTPLGSSNYMERRVQFSGILSSNPLYNPDFFNWNKVKIRYCDGASFAGHPESEFNNGTKLFFRGQLIWEAMMDELLSIGLSDARAALLSGCSAGGLATLIHCDDFREVLRKDANVKCVSDAGFFLNEKDISGKSTIESFYRDVVGLQQVAGSLGKSCPISMEPSKCFFPQQLIKSIKTPVFLVNPAYDFWQIRNILVPDASDPGRSWYKCKLNIDNCSPSQIGVLQGFRNSLLKALTEFQQRKDGGMFINSCYIHCQTWMTMTWHSSSSPRINNRTIAESVGDWFFDRKISKHIDCAYPCNPTCFNMDFTGGRWH